MSSGGEPVAEHFNGILYCSVSYNSVKENIGLKKERSAG